MFDMNLTRSVIIASIGELVVNVMNLLELTNVPKDQRHAAERGLL